MLPIHHQVGEAAFFILRNHHRTGAALARPAHFAAIHNEAALAVTTITRAVFVAFVPAAALHLSQLLRWRRRWGGSHRRFGRNRRNRRNRRFGRNGRNGGHAGGALIGIGYTSCFGGGRAAGLPGRFGLAATCQRAGQSYAASQQAQAAQYQRAS